jgi:hypothetical protein
MSSGLRPNDQMHLPGFGVPVDPWTGHPLNPRVIARLGRLKEAENAFRFTLHELDGTTVGSKPGDRRMAQAFTKLDEAIAWTMAAIMERGDG